MPNQQHAPDQQGRVQFDRDGMTVHCPLANHNEVLFANCEKCTYFIQSMGFTVICRKEIETSYIRSRS